METQIDYSQLAAAMIGEIGKQQGTRQKAVGASNYTWGHGPGGLFGQTGLSPDIANAAVMPFLGLQARLPVRASRETNPLHGIFTGVTGLLDGNKPNGPCDDAPTPGLAKLCTQTYTFGRQTMMTPVLDITRAGQVVNRGEFTDFYLVGGPTEANPGPTLPYDFTRALRGEVDKLNLEFKISWARENSKLIFTGNPTNNTGGGGYKEFRGADVLINTGYRDAETGVLCPAADSLVRNFASLTATPNITTNAQAANDIVVQVTAMYRQLRALARQTGLAPLTLGITMPEMLHYELTKVWPISYLTTAATAISAPQTNTQLNVDARDQAQMRDDMRSENAPYLLIDGQRVPVIYDDGVARGNSNGVFTSTIYFVPLTVLGGTPATYIEYFDFSAPGAAMDVVRALGIEGAFTTTDNGRYLWVKKPHNNFCVQAQVVEEIRLRLDFPFLAGRLTNVSYSPTIGTRSPFPSDADFYNGGKTNRVAYVPSFYPPNTSGNAGY